MKLWRLVQFIIIFAIFLGFIVLNLENKCNINFGFTVLEDVQVFLTAFFSFIAGMLCTLPFVFSFISRRKEKPVQGKGLLAKVTSQQNKNQSEKAEDPGLTDKTHYGID
jgi:hypothetical protein